MGRTPENWTEEDEEIAAIIEKFAHLETLSDWVTHLKEHPGDAWVLEAAQSGAFDRDDDA